MTTTLTAIDDTYSANGADGRKRMIVTASVTNPYTAAGELLAVGTYFKSKFLGGKVVGVGPSVSTTNAGIAASGVLRCDVNSTTTAVLQFFNVSLGGATAGMFVDNTVANLSSTTVTLELIGY